MFVVFLINQANRHAPHVLISVRVITPAFVPSFALTFVW